MYTLACSTLATMGMAGMYGAMQNTTNGFVTYAPASMYMAASNPTAQASSSQIYPSVFRSRGSSWKQAMAAGVTLAGLTAVSTEANAIPMDRPETSEQSATAYADDVPSPYALPIIGVTFALLLAATVGGLAWVNRSRGDESSKQVSKASKAAKGVTAAMIFAALTAISASADAFPMDRVHDGYGYHSAATVNSAASPYSAPVALSILGGLLTFATVGMWLSRNRGGGNKTKTD